MHVCINYHLAEPTSILPPSPCAQNWGTEALCFWENKMLLHSFGSFAEHNGQANLISSPCHDILKGRDNRQHESYNINCFSLFPISSLTSLPPSASNPLHHHHLFLLHKLSITPPHLCVVEQGFGDTAERGRNFIGPEPNNLINIALLVPFSFSPNSHLPSSVFRP